MKRSFSAICAALALSAAVLPIPSAQAREQRVVFAPRTSGTTISGSITGYDFVDYILNVRQGQVLSVKLNTPNPSAYFNLLEPGERDVATFIVSTSGNSFDGVARRSGDYRIRVYLMRAAARRGVRANFVLKVGVAGAAQLPMVPGDALVPGTSYHATGTISCTFLRGPARQCQFGVTRDGGGGATVFITRPNGIKRVVLFRRGKAIGYDKSQADRAVLVASRQSDNTVVRIGGEVYVIPDAVVLGG